MFLAVGLEGCCFDELFSCKLEYGDFPGRTELHIKPYPSLCKTQQGCFKGMEHNFDTQYELSRSKQRKTPCTIHSDLTPSLPAIQLL